MRSSNENDEAIGPHSPAAEDVRQTASDVTTPAVIDFRAEVQANTDSEQRNHDEHDHESPARAPVTERDEP
jgi:hypothetical protein